jgi:two-component system, LytTR family, sensor kinase
MKRSINIDLVKFYLWVGLAYFLIGIFGITRFYPGQFGYVVLDNLWGIILVIVLNFIFFEYSIPFIGKKRKFIIYNILWGILLVFIHCMLYSYGSYAWRLLGMQLHLYKELEKRTLHQMLQFQMTYSFMSVLFFGIIRHIYNYIKLRQASQQLKIEKQAAELNYLRSQTNPHFLFNTLNNIYSLARDKSDLAPESILRLSKILRFMLYETSASHIAVEQEIKVISDYIALEKLRYDETLRVDFNCDVDDMREPLPPLLLMPLVENAFKHGVSETRDHPFIDIYLSVNKSKLVFIVKNSADESHMDKDIKENIGLSNVRRQLELLYTDWSLEARQAGPVFTASLKINLAGNGKN